MPIPASGIINLGLERLVLTPNVELAGQGVMPWRVRLNAMLGPAAEATRIDPAISTHLLDRATLKTTCFVADMTKPGTL